MRKKIDVFCRVLDLFLFFFRLCLCIIIFSLLLMFLHFGFYGICKRLHCLQFEEQVCNCHIFVNQKKTNWIYRFIRTDTHCKRCMTKNNGRTHNIISNLSLRITDISLSMHTTTIKFNSQNPIFQKNNHFEL